MSSFFSCTNVDKNTKARTGRLALPHGAVTTPVFMPVGTNGTVKAMTKEDLEEIGFEIILANTYHLYLRPGTAVIGKAGGLHEWTRWKNNILTDSGGFQVFSLSSFRKISDAGVKFRSHIDGSYHMLTPERIVEIQAILRSDIQMQLDVCTSWGTEYKEADKALNISADWLRRAKHTRGMCDPTYQGSLFGIVQGNFYHDLRKKSAEKVIDADTPGIAIGGLSVGEPFEIFEEFLQATASLLPTEKPRYVMGIGTPEYIFAAIENGIDMFDCVFPTRIARNGMVFTHTGNLTLKKERNEFDMDPIDKLCDCKVCRTYSRSYLRHLYRSSEILAAILATYHNLYFLNSLVIGARQAIANGAFLDYKRGFLEMYRMGV